MNLHTTILLQGLAPYLCTPPIDEFTKFTFNCYVLLYCTTITVLGTYESTGTNRPGLSTYLH